MDTPELNVVFPRQQQILCLKRAAKHAALPDDLDEVLSYWSHACRGAFAPAWRDFRLVDLSNRVLPWAIITDIERDEGGAVSQMRYRYWGTEWTRLYHQEMTGKAIDAFRYPELAESFKDQYLEVIQRREPVSFTTSYPTPSDVRADFTILRLPLSDDGETVNKVACAFMFLRNQQAYSKMFDAINVAVV